MIAVDVRIKIAIIYADVLAIVFIWIKCHFIFTSADT